MLTSGIINMIKNRELKTALDMTPEAMEPALSMMYHAIMANFDTLIIFLSLAKIAGATIPLKKMAKAINNPAPIEESHLTSLLKSADKFIERQRVKEATGQGSCFMLDFNSWT
jgi:hypothetical protein